MPADRRKPLPAIIILLVTGVLASVAAASSAGTTGAPGATDPAAAHADHGGPDRADYIDIREVPVAVVRDVRKGSFVSVCGRNLNNHRNSDNFIVAPGVVNGAHHVHDYVGNLSTDGMSTNDSLAAAGTTCRFGDRSVYFWPVLRLRGTTGPDNGQPGGGTDGNTGRILRPVSVRLEFRGNRFAKVVAMPRFLRVITGDAKAATNGPANARAQWTCTGFADRLTQKYPLCPAGSRVQRVLDFPSCWDTVNVDSASHLSHIVFTDADGRCPQGTKAVAQLHMTLTYTFPRGQSYALDSFPEQRHHPLTDHADFANLMPQRLQDLMVRCINLDLDC